MYYNLKISINIYAIKKFKAHLTKSSSLDEYFNEKIRKERKFHDVPASDYSKRHREWPIVEGEELGVLDLECDDVNNDEEPWERRVSINYLDALELDEVNEEHKNYWFSDSRTNECKKMKIASQSEGFFASAENLGNFNMALQQLKENCPYNGIIKENWLYHGVKVDIGCEYDGLLPIAEEAWDTIKDEFEIGKKIEVVVVKKRDPNYYRWPIELKTTNSNLNKFLIDYNLWDPPLDLRGKSPENVIKNTGREYDDTQTYLLPLDNEQLNDRNSKLQV